MKKKMLVLNAKTMEFEEVELKNESGKIEYEELKTAIGGWIEHFSYFAGLRGKGIITYCHEEGKLRALKPSVLFASRGKTTEFIAGNIVFARLNRAGDTFGLTDMEIDFVKTFFKEQSVKVKIEWVSTEGPEEGECFLMAV